MVRRCCACSITARPRWEAGACDTGCIIRAVTPMCRAHATEQSPHCWKRPTRCRRCSRPYADCPISNRSRPASRCALRAARAGSAARCAAGARAAGQIADCATRAVADRRTVALPGTAGHGAPAGRAHAEPAYAVRDGDVIAAGHDVELDELRGIATTPVNSSLLWSSASAPAPESRNLKVEYNRVHGFYIEVSHGQAEKVPDDYRRRQTLKNAERYITPELKAFEDRALSAQERALAREKASTSSCSRRWRRRSRQSRPLPTRSRRSTRLGRSRSTRSTLDFERRVCGCARALRSEWTPPGRGKRKSTPSCRTTARSSRATPAASSPVRTWAANPRTCGRRR